MRGVYGVRKDLTGMRRGERGCGDDVAQCSFLHQGSDFCFVCGRFRSCRRFRFCCHSISAPISAPVSAPISLPPPTPPLPPTPILIRPHPPPSPPPHLPRPSIPSPQLQLPIPLPTPQLQLPNLPLPHPVYPHHGDERDEQGAEREEGAGY